MVVGGWWLVGGLLLLPVVLVLGLVLVLVLVVLVLVLVLVLVAVAGFFVVAVTGLLVVKRGRSGAVAV